MYLYGNRFKNIYVKSLCNIYVIYGNIYVKSAQILIKTVRAENS